MQVMLEILYVISLSGYCVYFIMLSGNDFFQTFIREKQSVFKIIYMAPWKAGRRKHSYPRLGSAQTTPGVLLAQTQISNGARLNSFCQC